MREDRQAGIEEERPQVVAGEMGLAADDAHIERGGLQMRAPALAAIAAQARDLSHPRSQQQVASG